MCEKTEWDGLALIERNGTKYINEPHVGGGNPVLAIGGDGQKTEAIFTDMLGTSLGTANNETYTAITKTSFGADTSDSASFFTGKPYVEDLGYAFLFRNYRADMGKWLSQDLIGYPDGWNNFAYCGNNSVEYIDIYGASAISSSNKAYVSIVLTNGSKYGSYVSSESDLNSLLSHANNDNKITQFTYTGHGSEETSGLVINNSNPNQPYGLTPYNFKEKSENFAEGMTLVLNVCYQGKYIDEYLFYLPDGSTVIAYTDIVEIPLFRPLSDEKVDDVKNSKVSKVKE